jgi:hypothetical protein
VYIADFSNYRIRALDLTTYAVVTFAGSGSDGNLDGIGTLANFNNVYDMMYNAGTGTLYAATASFGSSFVRAIETTTAAPNTATISASTVSVKL